MPREFDLSRRPPSPQAASRTRAAEPPRRPPTVHNPESDVIRAEVRPPAPPQPPPGPIQPAPPPQAPPAPSRQEVVNGLLHAMAVRELAMASLLNAEAEKVAQLARTMVRPETFDDVLTFQRTVSDLMQAVVRKEEILLRRLTAVLALCAAEEESDPVCDEEQRILIDLDLPPQE